MNDKISNLINELAEECDRQDVALSLSAFDQSGDTHITFCGRRADVIVSVFALNDRFEELMTNSDCDCPTCRAAKDVLKEKKRDRGQAQSMQSSDDDAIADFLSKIFGGGLSDNDQN